MHCRFVLLVFGIELRKEIESCFEAIKDGESFRLALQNNDFIWMRSKYRSKYDYRKISTRDLVINEQYQSVVLGPPASQHIQINQLKFYDPLYILVDPAKLGEIVINSSSC